MRTVNKKQVDEIMALKRAHCGEPFSTTCGMKLGILFVSNIKA